MTMSNRNNNSEVLCLKESGQKHRQGFLQILRFSGKNLKKTMEKDFSKTHAIVYDRTKVLLEYNKHSLREKKIHKLFLLNVNRSFS